MGLGDVTGSITEGKRADMILVRTRDLNMWPVGNIETAIVQGGSASDVDAVLADGRILKRDGRLLAYDVPDILRRAHRSATRIRNMAGKTLAF